MNKSYESSISTLATQTPLKSANKSTYSVFYKYKLVVFLLCNRPYMCSADIYCTDKELLLFSSSNFKSLFLKVYAIHTFFVILFFQVVKDTETQSVVNLSTHRNRKMFRNPFFNSTNSSSI